MNCKICNNISEKIFITKVLLKFDVTYFQCTNCQFIQTEKPYWLNEAYESAISNLDLGLIYRNYNNQFLVKKLINDLLNKNGKFVDYGGGYGMLVRLMRDSGFDFYRQDYFCENLFSKYFDVTDLPLNTKFELLCAFEVFEHIEDPKVELEKMLSYSDNIIFTTELQPQKNLTPKNWWYFIPETGQHISLFSKKSLGEKFDLNYQGYNETIHIFSKQKMKFNFKPSFKERILNKIIRMINQENKTSLLYEDFEFIKKKLIDN